MSSLQVLEAMVEGSTGLTELKRGMTKFPQTLVNVPLERKIDVCSLPEVQEAVVAIEGRLKDSGRVLLRPSGTEPVVRVMVEGRDDDVVESAARDLAEVVAHAARMSSDCAA